MRRVLIGLVIVVIGILVLIVIADNRHDPDSLDVAVFTFVDHPVLNTIQESFYDEMEVLGFTEGKNIDYMQANAEGEMASISSLSRAILRDDPDVIVPISTPVSRGILSVASPEQTIVYSFVTNPDDLEPYLSQGNDTGVSDRINYKRSLQLIRELFPKRRRLGMVYTSTERNSEVAMTEISELAPGLDFELAVQSISNASELRSAIRRVLNSSEVILVGPDNTIVGNVEVVLQAASEAGVPVFAVDSGSVEKGALAAYSVNYAEVGRETARLVERVIRNPGSVQERTIPVYNDDLILNRCAANALHYAFPVNVKGRARYIVSDCR